MLSEERLNESLELRSGLRSLGSTERGRERQPDRERQAPDGNRTEHISSCETFPHAHPYHARPRSHHN